MKKLILVLVMAVIAGCQSKPVPPKGTTSNVSQKGANEELVELAREMEKTLQRAADIQSAGGDTNHLLKELEKFRK